MLCAKIGIADFKPPCAEVRPEGKALFELGATGSVRHSSLNTQWFANGVGITQQGGVSCKGPNLAANARRTRVATFFDIVVRKECRLKLFHIRVEPFVRVLVVAQYAELLVRPKRQMPVAEAAVQGRRLRSRVQVERNVCVVFMTWFGFFTLVRLVVFGAERGLKARHRPKLPGSEVALGFPREVARLNELVAVLVVGFLARGVVFLGKPKAALNSCEFEAVLGFAFLPRAQGAKREGLSMRAMYRVAAGIAVLGAEAAVGSDKVDTRTTAVQAILARPGHAVGAAVEG